MSFVVSDYSADGRFARCYAVSVRLFCYRFPFLRHFSSNNRSFIVAYALPAPMIFQCGDDEENKPVNSVIFGGGALQNNV
jgi:hypothetical protein